MPFLRKLIPDLLFDDQLHSETLIGRDHFYEVHALGNIAQAHTDPVALIFGHGIPGDHLTLYVGHRDLGLILECRQVDYERAAVRIGINLYFLTDDISSAAHHESCARGTDLITHTQTVGRVGAQVSSGLGRGHRHGSSFVADVYVRGRPSHRR